MEQGASSFGDNRLDRANRFIQDRLASHGPDGLYRFAVLVAIGLGRYGLAVF